jgi:hypothetical protein
MRRTFSKDFPASCYQQFVGKTIESITDSQLGDEGLLIRFTDGTALEPVFSGCEGTIYSHGVELDEDTNAKNV